MRVVLALALMALLASGCVGFRPANVALEPETGRPYTFQPASRPGPVGDVYLYLAFSGGGTRAAAFAYGVLEELRDTQIGASGEPRRLLDEVDAISGVSGGSFTAAYYGLFGERTFEDFEARFLRKNVQGALLLQALRPKNLLRLLTPYLNRSELAAQYYDRTLFDGATFGDLHAAAGPTIYINATDLSRGFRFTFVPGQFNLICSDLEAFPVSRAVAASSAVPVLLSPVTLQNFAGRCAFQAPEWMAQALKSRTSDPRRYQAAQALASYMNAKERPYIHLVDGGISDNLGMRALLESVSAAGGVESASAYSRIALPDRIAVIIVDAETDPDPGIDLSAAAPSFAALMNSVSGSQIRRYNFETLVLTDSALRAWARELSTAERRVKTHLIDVSFDDFDDAGERSYFKRLPTSFSLSDQQVERLREAGRRLVRESEEFQALLRELQ